MKIPAVARPRGFFLVASMMNLNTRAYGTPLLLTLVLLCIQSAGADVDGAAIEPPRHQATADLTVYKKWIGASGNEANVEILLSCGENDDFAPRFINRDRPDGWRIEQVPADGMFCTVGEVERETFIADAEDCRKLLVMHGQDVECTMVNVKVVKRIDMLNRYGMGLMILVMLAAGLVSVRKFTPL